MNFFKNLRAKSIIKLLGPELKKLPDIKIIPGNHNSFIIVRTCNEEIEYCKLCISVKDLFDWIGEEFENKYIFDLFPSDKTSSIEELICKISDSQRKLFIKTQNNFVRKTSKMLNNF